MANSAQAATIQYSNLASFQANTTGLTNIDFEGIAPAGGSVITDLQNISGVGILSDLNGNGTYSNLIVDSAAPNPGNLSYQNPYNWGSGASISIGGVGRRLTFFLPTGTTAVGIDFMSIAPQAIIDGGADASTFDIAFDGGQSSETFTINPLRYPNRQFFGITFTKNISYFSVRGDSPYVRLFDNVTFGTASPAAATSVPEPFTVIGTLVGGTAALRMRKKLKSAQK